MKMHIPPAAAATLVLGLAMGGLWPQRDAAASGQQQGAAQQGRASYYATKFHGRRMANGQRFDAGSDSAAHRSLPFGTVLRVTNLANGRSAQVVVRDRGPWSRGRFLDLSPRTADELGMRHAGTATVAAEVLGLSLVEVAEAP